jgi:hypothetical protein
MFHDLIRVYADALTVATTLRPPVSAAPARESDRSADDEEILRASLSDRLVGWLTRWLRRGSDAPMRAASLRSFIRAPHL